MQQAQTEVQNQLKNHNLEKIANLNCYLDSIRARKKKY